MNQLYLIHHGIQGQKWGVTNGPPYPLDKQTHAKVTKHSVKNLTKQLNKLEDKPYSQRTDEDTVTLAISSDLKKRYSETSEKMNQLDQKRIELEHEYEYYTVGNGMDKPNAAKKVKELEPKLLQAVKEANDAYHEYRDTCEDITSSLVGKYGKMKVQNAKVWSNVKKKVEAEAVVKRTITWGDHIKFEER